MKAQSLINARQIVVLNFLISFAFLAIFIPLQLFESDSAKASVLFIIGLFFTGFACYKNYEFTVEKFTTKHFMYFFVSLMVTSAIILFIEEASVLMKVFIAFTGLVCLITHVFIS